MSTIAARNTSFFRSIKTTHDKISSVPDLVPAGDLYHHDDGLLYVPVVRAHYLVPDARWKAFGLDPAKVRYDFAAASEALLRNNGFLVTDLKTTNIHPLSNDEQAVLAVLRRAAGACGYSAKENKETFDKVTEAGITLPPVFSIKNAWDGERGNYGHLLMVRESRDGWQEVLARCTYDCSTREGGRTAAVYAVNLSQSAVVHSREAQSREVVEPTVPSFAIQRELVDYYINGFFTGEIQEGRTCVVRFDGPMPEIAPMEGFRLAALVASKKRTGVVLNALKERRGPQDLFVPIEPVFAKDKTLDLTIRPFSAEVVRFSPCGQMETLGVYGHGENLVRPAAALFPSSVNPYRRATNKVMFG